eukprot:9470850-Pyramimonas_sp.AAC.1
MIYDAPLTVEVHTLPKAATTVCFLSAAPRTIPESGKYRAWGDTPDSYQRAKSQRRSASKSM